MLSFKRHRRIRTADTKIIEAARSGLPMRTAAMEKGFVVRADEKLTAFLELESVIRSCGESRIE